MEGAVGVGASADQRFLPADQLARVQEGGEDFRVDITFATDGGRIAQSCRDLGYRADARCFAVNV